MDESDIPEQVAEPRSRPSEPEPPPSTHRIAGFWRRLGAFLIDGAILGGVGYVLAQLFGDVLSDLGNWGRLLGLVIALGYCGVLNSSIGRGQTLGKKILGLRVVDAQQQYLGPQQALIRAAVLWLPFMLPVARLPDAISFSLWMNLIYLIVFGGCFALAYLYIFNRVTRQSLHDFAARSYVVDCRDSVPMRPLLPPPESILITVGIVALAAAIAPNLLPRPELQKTYIDLLPARASLLHNPLVQYASLNEIDITSTPPSHTLLAQVFLRQGRIDDSSLAHAFASSIQNHYAGAREASSIQIILLRGFDIGLASEWQQKSYRFDPTSLNLQEN